MNDSFLAIVPVINILLGIVVVVGGFMWRQMDARLGAVELKQHETEVQVAGSMAALSAKLDALVAKVTELVETQRRRR